MPSMGGMAAEQREYVCSLNGKLWSKRNVTAPNHHAAAKDFVRMYHFIGDGLASWMVHVEDVADSSLWALCEVKFVLHVFEVNASWTPK